MHAEERRQAIEELIRSHGRGDVGEIAARFSVTPETVRRDLINLEHRGALRRVHGGAITPERLRTEPAIAEKAAVMAAEKRRIGRAALALVPRSGSILIDAGTTTEALARELPGDRELTVVTNSLPVALALSTRPKINLMMIGGRVRERTLATVDDWAIRALSELRVDIAFVATNGISIERGLTTPDPSEAAVKRTMVETGQRVVLLADHSKVGEESMVRFAHVADIDTFITDNGLDAGDAESFERVGIEVVRA